MSNSAQQKTVTALLAKTFMQVTLLVQIVMSQEFLFWGLTAEEKHMAWLNKIFSHLWSAGDRCPLVAARPQQGAAGPSWLQSLLSRVSREWIIKPRQSSLALLCPLCAAAQWKLRASALSCSGSEPISAVCFRGGREKIPSNPLKQLKGWIRGLKPFPFPELLLSLSPLWLDEQLTGCQKSSHNGYM